MSEQTDISTKKRMVTQDFFLVIISLLTICALIFIFLNPFSLPVRLSDHWMTVRLAEYIATGNPQVSPYWNLGYPALLALTAKITGGYETAEKVISLTCGLFLLLASYFLGRKYLGRYWGIAVLWLVAGTEFFVFNVLGLKDYILFAFLLVSAILSLEWAIKKERWWAFFIAGAILGLSFLRPLYCPSNFSHIPFGNSVQSQKVGKEAGICHNIFSRLYVVSQSPDSY